MVGWGILHFASELAQGIACHEQEYKAYESGAVLQRGEPEVDPLAYLLAQGRDVASLVERVNTLDKSVTRKAFGPDGLSGDEEIAARMAEDLVGIYAGLIAVGQRVRRAAVPTTWQPACTATSELARGPVHQIGEFSAVLTQEAGAYFGALRDGRSPARAFAPNLHVAFDPAALRSWSAAIATAKSC